MAVTISNTPSTNTATQTGTGASLTIPSVTVASGEMLVVAVTARYGATTGFVSTMTFNGDAMTSKTATITGGLFSSIWEIKVPDVATGDVVVTWSTSVDRPKIATAYVLAGADTATGVEATGTAGGTGTAISTSITTLTNNAFIIDAVVQLSDATNPTITKESAQTETINQEVQGSFGGRMGQSYKTLASAGATTMSWTSTNSLDWTASAVAIKPASAPATTFIPRAIVY